MRVARCPYLVAVGTLTLGAALSCDDPTEVIPPGSIEIVVLPSGPDVITDALRVTIGDTITRGLDTLGVTVSGLSPGVYAVELEGTSSNCQITGTNPRSVTVESSRIAVVTFTMSCTARVGSVRVTTTTTGPDADPDGYMATVMGGPSLAIGTNATITLPNVREGVRLVVLTGVASNCDVAGLDTIGVSVALGTTVDASFSIQCVGVGSLEVTVSTTGVEPDADGYVVVVDAPSVAYAEDQTVQPNGSITFARLLPAADYRVVLQHVAPNCSTVGASTVTVAVTAGGAASVAFDVVCEVPARLASVRYDDIWIIRHDGGAATQLTTDPAGDGEPAWSSTGRIAFTTRRHSNDVELYVMNEDGSNTVRLTTSAGTDDSPSWSSDGQRIVFRSLRDVNSEIYIIKADGTGPTRLTTNPATDHQPAWSSTGKIAFVSDRDHAAGEIYVMNEDGSNVVRLTQNELAESAPAWSPDGLQLAFGRSPECYSYYYYCTRDIIVMNADGSGVRALPTGFPDAVVFGDPSWAPNGRTIAFTQQRCPFYCDPPAVWIANLDGTQLALVAEDAANPAWKP